MNMKFGLTVLTKGNRSSPWNTRLSATLFTTNVAKVAHGQVSLRISLYTGQDVSQKLGFSPQPSEYVCIHSHYAMKLMSTSEIQLWTEHPITSQTNLSNTK